MLFSNLFIRSWYEKYNQMRFFFLKNSLEIKLIFLIVFEKHDRTFYFIKLKIIFTLIFVLNFYEN